MLEKNRMKRPIKEGVRKLDPDHAVADPGFSPGGAPTPKIAIIFKIFAENCMK